MLLPMPVQLSDAELQAVLAHELSHGLSATAFGEGFSFLALRCFGAFTGDLGALLTILPVTLLELSYARISSLRPMLRPWSACGPLGRTQRLAQALGRLSPDGTETGSPESVDPPPNGERAWRRVERVRGGGVL